MRCFVFSREILGKILYSNTHFKSIEEKEGKKEEKEQKNKIFQRPRARFLGD
jgi:hypothetical protein